MGDVVGISESASLQHETAKRIEFVTSLVRENRLKALCCVALYDDCDVRVDVVVPMNVRAVTAQFAGEVGLVHADLLQALRNEREAEGVDA